MARETVQKIEIWNDSGWEDITDISGDIEIVKSQNFGDLDSIESRIICPFSFFPPIISGIRESRLEIDRKLA